MHHLHDPAAVRQFGKDRPAAVGGVQRSVFDCAAQLPQGDPAAGDAWCAGGQPLGVHPRLGRLHQRRLSGEHANNHDRQRHSEAIPCGQGLSGGSGAVHGVDGDHPRRRAALHAGAGHGGPGMTSQGVPVVAEVIERPVEPKAVKGGHRWGDLILRVVAGLVLLYLFLPILVIILFLLHNPQGKFNHSWQGFTLNNWAHPFKYPALTDALKLSLNVAAVSTAIALVLGTLVAIALVRQRFRGSTAVDTFLVLPLTAPEVVMGAALLTLFLDFNWAAGYTTIVIAHIAFEISFIAMTVRARMRGFDWTIEDASMDLGARPARTFSKVTLPLIIPGIVAAGMLSFALSLDDFIITYFVSGSTVTYPLYVNAAVKAAVPPQINVLATAILGISLLLLAVGTLYRRKRIEG